jgi:hypothetical protein
MRIDMQNMSPISVMACYRADSKANQAFTRLLNEQISDTVAAHRPRFAGRGTLPMQDLEIAIVDQSSEKRF